MIFYELTLTLIAFLGVAYLGSFIDLSFMEREAFSKDNALGRSLRNEVENEDIKKVRQREKNKVTNGQTRRLWEVTKNLS